MVGRDRNRTPEAHRKDNRCVTNRTDGTNGTEWNHHLQHHIYRIYERKLEAYETAEHWDQEVVNVLQIKFRTGLTDLEIEEGMLPLD